MILPDWARSTPRRATPSARKKLRYDRDRLASRKTEPSSSPGSPEDSGDLHKSESESRQYVTSLIADPVVQILMAAAAAFQELEIGRSWLLTPSAALGNVAPVSLISTPAGREIVANELGLIEHGMF
jgi:hypothetical protein